MISNDNWPLYKLKDVTTYISRGKQPEYVEFSEIRTLNQKAIQWGEIIEDALKFHNPEVNVGERHFIQKNDVVINSTGTGTVGRTYHFRDKPKYKLFADSHVTIVRTTPGILNARFLMYQMSTSIYQETIISSFLAGSTGQVEFNKSKVESLPVSLPSIDVQNKIVYVLDNLDSKIELNKEIINHLEQISQTLFKHWFIDFEFPNEQGEPYKSSGGEMVESELGEIPKGWSVEKTELIAKFKNGKKIIEDKRRKDGKNKIFGSNGIIGFTNEILQESPSIVIGRVGANCGSLQTSLKPCWITDNAIIGTVKDIRYYFFLYLTLERVGLKGKAGGSAQPLINQNILKNISFVLPNEELLEKYHDISYKNLQMIETLKEENERLSELRDTLLPKLLSGEIEIRDELEV